MKKLSMFLLVFLVTCALTACGSEPNQSGTNANQPATTNQTSQNQNSSTPLTRDNSTAEQTTLYSGIFIVGEDIPAGRYVITGDGSGNLFVKNKGVLMVNEILDTEHGMGVPNVTVDLAAGNEIEISGINNVTFTPAETQSSTTLTTGVWLVGLDIPAGRYEVTCNDGESGNFFVHSGNKPVVNEILDRSGMGIGVEKIRVNLQEKQVVTISGFSTAIFTKQ